MRQALVFTFLVNLKCLSYQQHTEWFQELVEPLSYADGLWELPQVIMDDGLVVVKQTILNIIQTIRIVCRGVNLQDKDRRQKRSRITVSVHLRRSRTALSTHSLGSKEGVLRQHLPGSSAALKTASALLWLSGHFCKTSLSLHSWKSCSLLCWALVGPQGVSETRHTSQSVGNMYLTTEITTANQRRFSKNDNRMIASDTPAASFCLILN